MSVGGLGPRAPSPYGADLAMPVVGGVLDLDPGGGEVSGPDVVVQRVLRRLSTVRGSVGGAGPS